MKKIICIVISLMLALSSTTLAYADRDKDESKGYKNYGQSKKHLKIDEDALKSLLKQMYKNKEKRNELIKELHQARKQDSVNVNINLIIVNGEEVKSEVPPVIKYGRTLVPIRAITTALGADVKWDSKTSMITITKGNTVIELKLGSDIVKVNGKEIKLDVPAKSENGRTIVPVRFIAETFKQKVEWDNATGSIIIEDDDSQQPVSTPQGAIISINDNTIGTSSNQIQYSGNWGYGLQQGAYMNDNHWTESSGAYCQISFKGTQLKIYGAKAPNLGKATASIDGMIESDVDYYSQNIAINTLVYTSPIMAYGDHTLKLRFAGTKNSASSGYGITIDRVEVTQ